MLTRPEKEGKKERGYTTSLVFWKIEGKKKQGNGGGLWKQCAQDGVSKERRDKKNIERSMSR